MNYGLDQVTNRSIGCQIYVPWPINSCDQSQDGRRCAYEPSNEPMGSCTQGGIDDRPVARDAVVQGLRVVASRLRFLSALSGLGSR